MSLKLALIPFGLILVGGCSSAPTEQVPAPPAGDVGDTSSDALTSSSCDRNAILDAVSGARKTAIERGLTWYDADIRYSQSRYHDGYRTDCSGFVSMCWQLGTSFTTADFIGGGGDSHRLGSYADLLPGDALVYRSGGEGHIMLFVGWKDSAHDNACVIEERSTALNMQFHTRAVSSLHAIGYKPIRADNLPDAAPDPSSSSGGSSSSSSSGGSSSSSSSSGGSSSSSSSGGGAACHTDGDCNPGNNGSGQICASNQCVPGCHTSSQCPGSQHCSSGQCR